MRRTNDFCYFAMEKTGYLSMEYFIKRPKIQRKRLYYGISKFLTLFPSYILKESGLNLHWKSSRILSFVIDFQRKRGKKCEFSNNHYVTLIQIILRVCQVNFVTFAIRRINRLKSETVTLYIELGWQETRQVVSIFVKK